MEWTTVRWSLRGARGAAGARRSRGFDDAQLKPYPELPILVLSGQAYLRLLEGDHSLFAMDHMIDSLQQSHVLIFQKGRSERDGRNPGTLQATITVEEPLRLAGKAGTLERLRARVENTGDTTWLATENGMAAGYVTFGSHLFDAEGRPVRIGYLSDRLPRDVRPGEAVTVETHFPFPPQAGRFTLRLDLAVAEVTWFSPRGSPTTDLEMQVEWSDSRAPHRCQARIEPREPFPPRAEHGAFPLRLRLTNTGDTTWLAGSASEPGTVVLGVQRLAEDGTVGALDYHRLPLPAPVAPGETVEIEARVPMPLGPGGRRFAVDLVAEGHCWFAQHGSKTLAFSVE